MANLSELNLTPAEPVDLSGLVPSARFPVKGRYTLKVTEPPTFGQTQAGHLSAEINPVIVGGPSDGYQVRYVKLSAKTYPDKKGGATSQVAQFLAACGIRGELSGDPQEAADAIESTLGATFEASIDWETPFSSGLGIRGMENFTPNPTGDGFLPYIETAELDENGKAKRVRARAVIRYYNAKR